METVEPVIRQDLNINLEEVLSGVKDVVIIRPLFKSINYTYVDAVLER
jgi:hypothetical protein